MNVEPVLSLGIGILFIIAIFVLPIIIISIIGEWKLFKKCGKEGWEAIIPYYADWILVQISGCHWWYFLLVVGNTILTIVTENTELSGLIALLSGLTSLVSVYAVLCINFNIAKKFHQGTGFAVGMTFVPVVFYLILGLSDKYKYDETVEVSPWGLYDFDKKISNVKKTYCSNCGSEMSGNFCPKCGNSKKGE